MWSHIVAAKRALRYLKDTKNKKLNLKPGEIDELSKLVDAIWANLFEEYRRSRSKMLVKFGGAVFVLTTTLQKCVTHSSTESEYVSMSKAVRTLVWLRNVLEELGVKQKCLQVLQNNIGCIEWAVGGAVRHVSKRKHIENKHYYIMSTVQQKQLEFVPVRTTKMKADFLKKPFT